MMEEVQRDMERLFMEREDKLSVMYNKYWRRSKFA